MKKNKRNTYILKVNECPRIGLIRMDKPKG